MISYSHLSYEDNSSDWIWTCPYCQLGKSCKRTTWALIPQCNWTLRIRRHLNLNFKFKLSSSPFSFVSFFSHLFNFMDMPLPQLGKSGKRTTWALNRLVNRWFFEVKPEPPNTLSGRFRFMIFLNRVLPVPNRNRRFFNYVLTVCRCHLLWDRRME